MGTTNMDMIKMVTIEMGMIVTDIMYMDIVKTDTDAASTVIHTTMDMDSQKVMEA